MALTLLAKRPQPKLGYGDVSFEFDAVLEDTLERSVTLSDYPLEVGVNSNDHRFINPVKWSITGAVSNNPLKTLLTDFTGALTEISSDSGILAATGGIMAGVLGGSDESRTLDVLEALTKLMHGGEPFTVFAGDVTLKNMVIESIKRTKDASNQNSLIFTADLREWQSIETALSNAGKKTNAETGTDTASAGANDVDKGEFSISDTATNIKESVSGWFSSVTDNGFRL